MAVCLPNISSVHVKGGLMSLKVRLDIASHSISFITIDCYRVWIIQTFKYLLRILRFELSGLLCSRFGYTKSCLQRTEFLRVDCLTAA